MPVKIFFCYAHEDESLLNKLKTHLRPLQQEGLIDFWHDRDISAGIEWEQAIKEHLDNAQIILLLVSPDFMNSDYIYSNELKRSMERHERKEARVIPVILRPVYWQGVLRKLQALPTDAKPIMSSSWQYQDEAFFNVAEGVRKVAEEITSKSSPPSSVLLTHPPLQAPLPTNLPDEIQKTKEQWLEEGHRFRDLKQFSKALAAYEQALFLDSNDALAYSNKGYALNQLRRYQEALEACEQALRLNPNDLAACNNKGVALIHLKRYQEALEACEQALLLNSNDAGTYNNKGEALIGLKRYQEALEALEQALRLDPNFANAYNNKGNAMNGLNKKKEALQAYEKALQFGYSE